MNNKGIRKAAIVLSTLGVEDKTLFQSVMAEFSTESARDSLIREIGSGEPMRVAPDERDKILQDFHEIMERQQMYGDMSVDPLELIGDLLPSGSRKRKSEMLDSILNRGYFRFLRDLSGDEIYNVIRHENPQTIALILFLLPSETSAEIFNKITSSIARNDIARRIAEMSDISDEILSDVEETLKERFSVNAGKYQTGKTGSETLAQILVRVDGAMQTEIIDKLQTDSPIRAREVRDKLFVFEDIMYIDDNTMRRVVLKAIDYMKDLPKALKDPDVPEDLKQKFANNIGTKLWEQIDLEMELLGPIPRSQAEEAQRNIVDKIRTLENAGQLTINRDFKEEELV